jgi:imidazolonepropionase-like amidohydrolase
VDLAGKTVVPGMFDTHGHCFTVDGKTQFESYPLLYLAAGVTSVFSPGEVDAGAAIELRERVRTGKAVGARLFTAGPYFEHGAGDLPWIEGFAGPDGAVAQFELWRERIDGVKVLNHVTEEELVAVLERAKQAGIRVTGHLGAIHAKRAAELGIDRLEHGIYAMGELSPDLATTARGWQEHFRKLAELDMDGELVRGVADALVKHGVVLSPTSASFESMLPGWEPVTPDWLRFHAPAARRVLDGARQRQDLMPDELAAHRKKAFANQLRFIRMVHERGGVVVTGTDPAGKLLTPGFSLHRELKLLCDAGLAPLAALRAATSDAARALGVDQDLGSLEAGKLADFVVLDGDPSRDIRAISKTVAVYQSGRRHDPQELLDRAAGKIR